jgi:flavin reductase (DIM6/NTAB) family NADH-FMN oxidoreductase RutF
VLGTYDKAGKPNVMTVAWMGICCSQPPCIAVALRKATYSYDNIIKRQAFTISLPSEKFIRQVDFFGIVSGAQRDKLAAVGLTPVKGNYVDAPYIKEFPLVMECRVVKMLALGLHTQFIGEIVDVQADEEILTGEGTVDVARLQPYAFVPDSQAYYGLGKFLGKAFSVGEVCIPIRKQVKHSPNR